MLVRTWLAVVGLVLAFGCDRGVRGAQQGAAVTIDSAGIESEVADRVALAFSRPAVSNAADEFFSALLDDTKLHGLVTRLGEELLADPTVASALDRLLGHVGDSDEMQATVTRLMAEHPDASPDDIGQLAERQFERAWETPEVSAAWNASSNVFLSRLELGAALRPVERAFVAKVEQLAGDEAARTRKWSARLVLLHGGTRPSPSRARELYLQHAWSPERIDAVLIALLADPEVRSASASAVAKLIAVDAIAAQIKRSASMVIDDATLQQRISAAMAALYAPNLDERRVRVAITDVLTHPPVVAASRDVVLAIVAHPRTGEAATAWFERVHKSQAVRRTLQAFFDEW
jgi:hypothetical protein